jgi:hypothetical protein
MESCISCSIPNFAGLLPSSPAFSFFRKATLRELPSQEDPQSDVSAPPLEDADRFQPTL